MIDNPQTDRTVEERVARHLAARDWLTTEDRWDGATASFRAEYLAAAREVIALVLPAVPVPPTTPAAVLTDTDRQFLTFALDLAADRMASRGDEFSDEDTAALEKLRRMADEAQQQPEVVPCMRSEAHPPHLHSGLRKGVAVHGRCPGGSAAPVQQPAPGPGRAADEGPRP